MARTAIAVSFAVVVVAVGVGGAWALAPAQQSAPQPSQQAQGPCDYQQVYDRTIDSVVSVQTETGQGSGFVTQLGPNDTAANDADENASTIITNAHVVGQSDQVTIQFNDGEYRTGEIVGQSTYADLAVVSVNATPGYVDPIPVAEDDPQRGQAVAALGAPFGLERTITHGIVSGVNRSMPTDLGFTIPNVVQTDAAINPGNSGGPLVSCDGTVVGVNTAGIPSQRAENVGFALSASVVQSVAPDLAANGEFDYPFLGVSTETVTPALAEANDLNETRGVMVAATLDDGPASGVLQERTGTEIVDRTEVSVGGDVILAIDDQPVRTGEDLASYLVTEVQPGDDVELTVVRDGERQTVSVTVGERPDPGTN